MGISRIGLNIVKKAMADGTGAKVAMETAEAASRPIFSKTDKEFIKVYNHFKLFGFTQGERKILGLSQEQADAVVPLLERYNGNLQLGNAGQKRNKILRRVLENSETLDKKDIALRMEYVDNPDIDSSKLKEVISVLNRQNKSFIDKLLADKSITAERLAAVSHLLNRKENQGFLFGLLKDKKFDLTLLKELLAINLRKSNQKVIKEILKRGDIDKQEMLYIAGSTTPENADIALMLMKNKKINPEHISCVIGKLFGGIDKANPQSVRIFEAKKKFITDFYNRTDIDLSKVDNFEISGVVDNVTPENKALLKDIVKNPNVNNLYNLATYMRDVKPEDVECAKKLMKVLPKEVYLLGDFERKEAELLTKLFTDTKDIIENPSEFNEISHLFGCIDEKNYDEVIKIIKENSNSIDNIVDALETRLLGTPYTKLRREAYALSSAKIQTKNLYDITQSTAAKVDKLEQIPDPNIRRTVRNELDKAVKNFNISATPDSVLISKQSGLNASDNIIINLNNGSKATFDGKTGKLVKLASREDMKYNTGTSTTAVCKTNEEAKLAVRDDFFGQMQDVKQPYFMETTLQKGRKTVENLLITESSIPGQYEIFDIMPNGRRFKTGLAEIGKNGEKHVERHLVSTDGKTTDLVYRDDNKGNTFLYSVIKDKNGKVISETRRKFKKISKNHFVSSFNGQSYDIKWNADKVVITKLDSTGKKTKETVEYAIKDVDTKVIENIYFSIESIPNDQLQAANKLIDDAMAKAGIAPYTIDTKVVDMVKKLPGDEWFNMKKSNKYVTAGNPEENNACFGGNAIFMSKQQSGNFGVFAHELGHAKFTALGLDKDKKLLSIYNKERKRYQEMFPQNMQESIEYFLDDAEGLRGLNESAAETNLLNDTIQSWEGIQSRTIFLEKYFPETIAYIKNKFSAL